MRPHTNAATTQVLCLNSDGTLLSGIAIIQTSPAAIPAPTAMNSVPVPIRYLMVVPSGVDRI